MRFAILVLIAPLVALTSGCASYMSAQVTSFHQLSAQQQLAGKRFAVEPSPAQKDSLEFRAYADLVSSALVRHGLVQAGSGGADLGVAVQYSLGDGKAVAYSYPDYGYAQFGPVWGWTPYRTASGAVRYALTPAYPLSYGYVGTRYSQSVLYRRELRVEITDLRRRDSAPARLFEGTAISEGESPSLAPVMPALVRALFREFPGPSGVSRVVQVPLDQRAAAASPVDSPAAREPPGR